MSNFVNVLLTEDGHWAVESNGERVARTPFVESCLERFWQRDHRDLVDPKGSPAYVTLPCFQFFLGRLLGTAIALLNAVDQLAPLAVVVVMVLSLTASVALSVLMLVVACG